MSDWHPRARKHPLPYAGEMPLRKNVAAVCGHTNDGGSDLFSWFSRRGNTVASHFQIFWDGSFDQFIPASRQAYAEVQGNDHCVSIEMQDDGDPSKPLTARQIAAFIDICDWVGAPARIASETGPGVGWHSLYASWNPHGHSCPGSVRVAQIRTLIIPRLGDGDMAELLVPTSDNNPHHKPGTMLPLAQYLQELAHEIFAIRSIVVQDLTVDKSK